jgi:hypothetical protein
MLKLFRTIKAYFETLLGRDPKFTGQLEMHFKDGELRDIYERKRVKP